MEISQHHLESFNYKFIAWKMMNTSPLVTNVKYYGISPWELEVIYGLLNSRFKVNEEEIEPEDPNFVSMLILPIPLSFNEEFFKWFEFRRWDKVIAIFKEMKRRRGSRRAIKIDVSFLGDPKIRFIVDSTETEWFNKAVEKIEFVLELIPYHLDPSKIPANVHEVEYKFDNEGVRWRLHTAMVGQDRFVFSKNQWNLVT